MKIYVSALMTSGKEKSTLSADMENMRENKLSIFLLIVFRGQGHYSAGHYGASPLRRDRYGASLLCHKSFSKSRLTYWDQPRRSKSRSQDPEGQVKLPIKYKFWTTDKEFAY